MFPSAVRLFEIGHGRRSDFLERRVNGRSFNGQGRAMLTLEDFRGDRIAWGEYLDELSIPGMELREPEGRVRPLQNLEMVAITKYLRAARRERTLPRIIAMWQRIGGA
jgi:hypothetical protein